MPDTLKLNFTLDGKPVEMSLERSDSIPADPPVIVSRNNRRTYWTRQPGSVNAASLLIISHSCTFPFTSLQLFITARSKLRKVLFLALSVTFLFVNQIYRACDF